MKQSRLFILLGFYLLAATLPAQITFTNRNNLLTPNNNFSGVAIGVTDMNGDGLDDIIRMNQGRQLSIEYQTANNQPFLHLPIGEVSNESQWGMCAADIDNNGFTDILTGGSYDGIKIIRASADGSDYTISTMAQPSTFVQGVNFADINNDGWLDAFVCHDDGPPRILANDGAGGMVHTTTWIDVTTLPASDGSGNYGTVWSDVDNDNDLDLYIAKCRQGVNNPADGRRINQLFLNNGDGTYTQDLTNASGLRIGAQSWTADFGDIDNDGDFDCFITNHDVPSQLLENDGAGHFTDITFSAGISLAGEPIQGIFRDFDNDGFVDILVAGSDHYLLQNNGNKTFTAVANPFGTNEMESFAVGDLNQDGFQDIYGGYAFIYTTPSNKTDVLWVNNGNANHYFGLNLRGVQSNRSAVGTKVTLYSALGTQVREVRSGESYGIMNSMQIHFGLGQLTEIDSVVVRWPAGTIDVLYQPLADQHIILEEGGCIARPVSAVANGPVVFCTGQSVVLQTTEDYISYQWSTGDTTATVTVGTAGQYKVTVTNADGCTAVSNAIPIALDPIEIPSVSVFGDTIFCVGGSVLLSSTPAAAYLWSTGDTTQSIAVTATGNYNVTTQGLCAQFNSAPQSVTVLAAPAPTATGDTTWVGGTVVLSAVGDGIIWYEDAFTPVEMATGETVEITELNATDTFWVSAQTIYDEPNAFTGMTDHSGTVLAGNTFNGQIIFDCFKPFRLARVKVYGAVAGPRKIDLLDNTGAELQSLTIDIPADTTVIELNFDIPVGTNLVLTTDESVNDANFGTASPQLYRSSEDLNYPYEIPGVVSIKGSNSPSVTDRYYYFYDWEIDYYAHECVSERIAVIAVVDPNLVQAAEPAWAASLKLFPNPVSGILNLELDGLTGGDLGVSVRDARGALLQSQHSQAPAGKMRRTLDLSAFAQGVYWVELATEEGVVRRKVVVQ